MTFSRRIGIGSRGPINDQLYIFRIKKGGMFKYTDEDVPLSKYRCDMKINHQFLECCRKSC